MDVHLTRRLAIDLRAQLQACGDQLPRLLDQVELPLEPVLAVMEATGIRIDLPYLGALEGDGRHAGATGKDAKDAGGR